MSTVSDDELHAYADDLLAPERLAVVEAALASDPEAAARVAFYRQLNADLHRLYGVAAHEPATAHARPPRWQQAAIAAGMLVVGLLGGWVARDWIARSDPATSVVQTAGDRDWPVQAARAHAAFAVERRHPVEVTADDEAHLVQWLSNRLGQPVRAPKLDSLGFRLVGGRLLPRADGGVAGQFMYEAAVARANDSGPAASRITLYVKPGPGMGRGAEFQLGADGAGNSIFYWLDDRFGYALVGALPQDELLPLAREVFAQLQR